MRMRMAGMGAALAGVVVSGPALAQDVLSPELNAQHFRPPVDSRWTLWTDDAGQGPLGYLQARAYLHYVNDPLVYEYPDGAQVPLLADLLMADFVGAVGLGPLRLGTVVPVALMTSGEGARGGGLGDVALDLKGTILDPDERDFALALSWRNSFPTANTTASIGSPGVAWELSAIATQRFGRSLLAVNIGHLSRPETALENVAWQDQFLYRAGLGHELRVGGGLSVDVAGARPYGTALDNRAGWPLEFLAGVWGPVSDDIVVRGGLGTGLTRGIGSPDLRMVMSVGYEPPQERDRDLDGIVNREDECPDDPEDYDGYHDVDGCPDPSTTVHFTVESPWGGLVILAETVVQTETGAATHGPQFSIDMHPGDYSLVADAPRYAHTEASFQVQQPDAGDQRVRVEMDPMFGFLSVRVTDTSGAPIDAILVIDDESPRALVGGSGQTEVDPGTHLLLVRANGYKSDRREARVARAERTHIDVVLQDARARVATGKIEIFEKVYFDTNRATIRTESFALLDEVAEIMRDNRDIQQVRIEGHTDQRASDAYNQRLSERRAASVRQYLMDQGISPSRLHPQGYGEQNLVDERNVREAWDRNRRVEFVITERATVD